MVPLSNQLGKVPIQPANRNPVDSFLAQVDARGMTALARALEAGDEDSCDGVWGFPKLAVPLFRVLILKNIVYWGLYWGPRI